VCRLDAELEAFGDVSADAFLPVDAGLVLVPGVGDAAVDRCGLVRCDGGPS
jgi:hypothetical protein